MKKILTLLVIGLFLFSIAGFAKDGADDSGSSSSSSSVESSSDDTSSSSSSSSDDSIDDVTDDSRTGVDDSSDDFVNGTKLRGDGTIDDSQNETETGDDSSDDFVNGTKLRGDGTIDDDQFENETGDDSRNRGRNENEIEVHSSVTGLENAVLRVQKNETREHLEDVLSKIEEKRKEQIAKLEKVIVENDEKTNKTTIKGKGRAKLFGFISMDKTYEYEVDDNGNVIKHRKFFDFMFKSEDPVQT